LSFRVDLVQIGGLWITLATHSSHHLFVLGVFWIVDRLQELSIDWFARAITCFPPQGFGAIPVWMSIARTSRTPDDASG
jgi:hypothetical protein